MFRCKRKIISSSLNHAITKYLAHKPNSLLSWMRFYDFSMREELTNEKKDKLFSFSEIIIIVLFAIVPLFMTFPYRVNIFLSWEGAYRLSSGQVPFRDFGIPMGYMYWVIPALFFKIFGPQMIVLVKAQVLINIISGLAFRSLLKSLSTQPGVRLLCVLLYCISFSFFNFWPWYNHTVIVYEMVGLAFLMRYLFSESKKWVLLSLSAIFIFFSFFTKQDGGALAFMICLALLVYHCIYEKNWRSLVIFLSSFFIVALAIIVPLLRFNFAYWFNHGQPPHTSRVSVFEIADEFFYSSQWIKFYLFLIGIIVFAGYKSFRQIFSDKRNGIFLLLTLGILAEASVLQVTSYTPPDNNIFFHAFAFAFILSGFAVYFKLNLYRSNVLVPLGLLLILWWSGVFWKYIRRLSQDVFAKMESPKKTNENVVNRETYILHPSTGEIPTSQWTFSNLKSFRGVYMPKPTVEGTDRLLKMPMVKNTKNLRVLNMSELTPLEVEMPYHPETGPGIPLWYHLGVSMFNKQAEEYERKLLNHEYDLVLFEYIPSLNNFYPFRIRDTLLNHYSKIDSFPAPRGGNTPGIIEVFSKPIH